MRVKYLLSFVLFFGMSLLCSPDSVALTVNGFDKSDAFSKSASFSSNILNGAYGSIDPGMLIYPKYNCDTEMCITTVPGVDPGFLIRGRQN
jgi:hypothetical protein